MTKARILANTVSTGNVLADGNITPAEIGAQPSLGSGTTGQVLLSQGAGMAPVWGALPAGTPDFILFSQGVI
jgi:hypothetical protein